MKRPYVFKWFLIVGCCILSLYFVSPGLFASDDAARSSFKHWQVRPRVGGLQAAAETGEDHWRGSGDAGHAASGGYQPSAVAQPPLPANYRHDAFSLHRDAQQAEQAALLPQAASVVVAAADSDPGARSVTVAAAAASDVPRSVDADGHVPTGSGHQESSGASARAAVSQSDESRTPRPPAAAAVEPETEEPTAPRLPPTVVPRQVFINWHTSRLPRGMRAAVETMKAASPTFDFRFFDSGDMRDYIAAHATPAVLNAFDSLRPQAYRADLFRYFVLYREGGMWCVHELLQPRRSSCYRICTGSRQPALQRAAFSVPPASARADLRTERAAPPRTPGQVTY